MAKKKIFLKKELNFIKKQPENSTNLIEKLCKFEENLIKIVLSFDLYNKQCWSYLNYLQKQLNKHKEYKNKLRNYLTVSFFLNSYLRYERNSLNLKNKREFKFCRFHLRNSLKYSKKTKEFSIKITEKDFEELNEQFGVNFSELQINFDGKLNFKNNKIFKKLRQTKINQKENILTIYSNKTFKKVELKYKNSTQIEILDFKTKFVRLKNKNNEKIIKIKILK